MLSRFCLKLYTQSNLSKMRRVEAAGSKIDTMSEYLSPQQLRREIITLVTQALATQYEGWRSDYLGSLEELPLDPVVMDSGLHALEALDAIPPTDISFDELATLQKLAHALAKGPFMSWLAHDPVSHAVWDPLLESYKEFKINHPDAEPFLASPQVAASLEQQLVGFFLQKHGRRN
jgi:hypothetical protein